MTKNVYVLSIDKENIGVYDSWRYAYLRMLHHMATRVNHWTPIDVIRENVDDRFVWMDTDTGECVFAIIDEFELNDCLPKNNYD